MRVGFFTDHYLPMTDGVSTSTEIFRAELEKLGHEVFVFAPRPSLRYRDRSKRIIRYPAVKGLFFEDYFTTFFFPPKVMRDVDKLKLDVIHVHTPGQIGLFGTYYALQRKLPLVTTYHTDLYEYVLHYPAVLPGILMLSLLAPLITGGGISEYRSSLASMKPERTVDKWNQKIVQKQLTMIHNHSDLIIAPSIKIARQLKRWKTTSAIEVLPTGINRIEHRAPDVKKFAKQFDLDPTDRVILFIGRISTEKNLSMLLRAFDLVAATDHQAKLILVGTGDDMEAFKQQALTSTYAQRIMFTGRLDRNFLGAVMANATVFAFPSVTDTQGLVINEAAWAGLPIVLVDHGISTVVQNNKNGYIAKNDPKDMAAKILTLLKDPAKQREFGKKSELLAAKFDSGTQALKLLRLYEETIRRHYENERPTRH